MLIATATLVALSTVWLSPGRQLADKMGLSVGVIAAGIVLATLAPQARLYADVGKLRRIVPHLSVEFAPTSKSHFGPAGDDRYGLVVYDYGGKRDDSRSTSSQEVLPLLYNLAGVTVAPSEEGDYPGYPIVADTKFASVWFYAGLPLLFALAWWSIWRRLAKPRRF